jgi:phosphatidylglycerophosphatase GEP4
MQQTCSAPFPNCCYPIPNQFHFLHPLRKRPKPINLCLSNNQTHFTNSCALTITPTISVTKLQEKNNNEDNNPSPDRDPSLFLQFYSCLHTNDADNQDPETQNQEQEEEQRESKTKKDKGFFTNMWWAQLKAALGQRFNFEGIVSSAMVVVKDRQLALPHVSVPDIRYIDWVELHRRGFKGVVFDKDNTLTAPYSLKLWGPLGSSLEQCKSVFGADIAAFSNSSGNFGTAHLRDVLDFVVFFFFFFFFNYFLFY